jgi:Mg/Co/Ni transporter MgtE
LLTLSPAFYFWIHPAWAFFSVLFTLQDETSDDDVIASSAREMSERKSSKGQSNVVLEAWNRGKWLLGLLVLQSMSSVVLDRYQDLVREHIVITLFLTMLVGAGGNAGNQSAIKVRGPSSGTRKDLKSG